MTDETNVDVLATDLIVVELVLDRLDLNSPLPSHLPSLGGPILTKRGWACLLAHPCLGRCFTGQLNEGRRQMHWQAFFADSWKV